MASKDEPATKTYAAQILCPHCHNTIVVRGRFLKRLDQAESNSLDKAFSAMNVAFDSVGKALRNLKFP
jgi:hypothetical protein